MSISDPPTENNPGHYTVDGIEIVAPTGETVVTLGDSISPIDNSFLDLQPSDSVIVATYDTSAGDPVMIEVVGSDKMERIAAETLDSLLGARLARER